MKPVDLTAVEHKTFLFLYPTEHRISNSVAWLAVCKRCGHEQLVGSAQIKRGTHASCELCKQEKSDEKANYISSSSAN